MNDLRISYSNKAPIGILGCGWLGTALAKVLLEQGFKVRGTVRKQEKMQALQKLGVDCFQLNIEETKLTGNIAFFDRLHSLIVCIPPGLRKNPSTNFIKKIEMLLPYIDPDTMSKIILTSSISVYGPIRGTVDETTTPLPSTESGKQLLIVENLLTKFFGNKMIKLRLGGLISNDRHPIYSLAKKKEIVQASAPVNLIHQTDAVNAIITILQQPNKESLYNIVAPFHPSKKTYYSQLANQWQLSLPNFTKGGANNKRISSNRFLSEYSYVFKVEKLLIE